VRHKEIPRGVPDLAQFSQGRPRGAIGFCARSALSLGIPFIPPRVRPKLTQLFRRAGTSGLAASGERPRLPSESAIMTSTLSRLTRPLVSRRPQRRRPYRKVPALSLEALEDRLAPAVLTWTGNADHATWELAGNWDLGRAPQNGDDVAIPIVTGSTGVTHAG